MTKARSAAAKAKQRAEARDASRALSTEFEKLGPSILDAEPRRLTDSLRRSDEPPRLGGAAWSLGRPLAQVRPRRSINGRSTCRPGSAVSSPGCPETRAARSSSIVTPAKH